MSVEVRSKFSASPVKKGGIVTGIFSGAIIIFIIVGLIWSAMYLRYQSIFPGYISHVFADIAVFCCGAWILFG